MLLIILVTWAVHTCKRVTTYGFGGGIDLLSHSPASPTPAAPSSSAPPKERKRERGEGQVREQVRGQVRGPAGRYSYLEEEEDDTPSMVCKEGSACAKGQVRGPAARYNYYSIHRSTTDHVLWPWHDWLQVKPNGRQKRPNVRQKRPNVRQKRPNVFVASGTPKS